MLETEAEWIPKTKLGKMVKNGEITSIDQIFDMGQKIFESEIVDMLVPDLKTEVIKVSVTQRMTDCGRKSKTKAIVIVGSPRGYFGYGTGKAAETATAVNLATRDAKQKLIRVSLACSSWECGCGTPHTVAVRTEGESGTTRIELRPAPRGVGIVANDLVKQVLALAGIKDVWTKATGHTSNIENMVKAIYNALNNINKLKTAS